MPRPHTRAYARVAVRALALLVLTGMTLGMTCGRQPAKIDILAPAHGSFIDDTSVLVSGTVTAYGPDMQVEVNGVLATLDINKTWTATVPTPLDAGAVANPIVATLSSISNGFLIDRERIVVVAGESILDGAYSPEAVGLRFNNSGLEELEPIVEDLAGDALDIGSIIGSGPILDNECVLEILPGVCGYWADASVFEIGFSGFGLDATAQAGHTSADISIDDLFLSIDLTVRDAVAVEFDCRLEVSVDSTLIESDLDMVPDSVDASLVDVNMIGDPGLTLTGVDFEFISGICDPGTPVIGAILGLFLNEQTITDLMSGGFEESLGDPDGTGPLDSPLAEGVETALGGISIAGAVSQALGASLDAPFFDISEDVDGITLGADAAFVADFGPGPGQCIPPAGAPDFSASYHVDEDFPTLGALTPVGGVPYGLGLGISTSAFNQLMKATTECGLLQAELTTLDGIPIDSTTLGLVVPEFVFKLGHGVPLKIRITPTIAPMVTGNPGPAGELAELVIAHLVADVIQDLGGGAERTWLSVSSDVRVGFDFNWDPVDTQLVPSLTEPPPSALTIFVLDNEVGAGINSVQNLFPQLFAPLLPSLSDTLGAFGLPTFFGLGLDVVEIGRAGSFMTIFADLFVPPVTEIQNVQFTDLSSADYVQDDAFTDVYEWGHRTDVQSTPSSIDTKFQGVLGAWARFTLGDRTADATGHYKIDFDVVPIAGEDWQLTIDHSILGALTLVDHVVGIWNGGGTAEFDNPITATVKVDGGAPSSFDFLPSPSSRSHSINGNEGNTNDEFGGTNQIVIAGTEAASVELEFVLDLHTFSNSNVAFPSIEGDEACIRFGKNDTITNGFSAGGYPGLGGRDITTDGHFVHVELLAVPE